MAPFSRLSQVFSRLRWSLSDRLLAGPSARVRESTAVYVNNTTADLDCSVPDLPQELIDRIVDHVWYCIAELRSCTLVSKAWSSRSSQHLLRNIYVQTRLVARFAKDIQLPSSRILAYMERLRIDRSPGPLSRGQWIDDGGPQVIDISPLIPAVFKLSLKLQRFEVQGAAFGTELIVTPRNATPRSSFDLNFLGTVQLVGIDGPCVVSFLQQFRSIANLHMNRILAPEGLSQTIVARTEQLRLDVIEITGSLRVLDFIEPLMQRSKLAEIHVSVGAVDVQYQIASLNLFLNVVALSLEYFSLRREDETIWNVHSLPKGSLSALEKCCKLHKIELRYWEVEDWDFIVHHVLGHMPPVLRGAVWINIDYRGLLSFTQTILDRDWSPFVKGLDRCAGLAEIAFHIESTWLWGERNEERVFANLPERYRKMVLMSDRSSPV